MAGPYRPPVALDDTDDGDAEGFSSSMDEDDPEASEGMEVEIGVNTVDAQYAEDAEEALQAAFDAALHHAEGFAVEDLRDQRIQALNYYNGQMTDLPAPEGRSSITTTDVRDTVNAQMPSLLRIFFGSDSAVEFPPQGPEDEAHSKQITDYINRVVIREDNPGFTIFHGWFKDALITSMGIVKWWWEPFVKVHRSTVKNLPIESLELLLSSPDSQAMQITILSQDQETATCEVEIVQEETTGRSRFRLVRPEEFLYIPNMMTLDDPGFVCQDTILTVAELMAMGVDVGSLDDAYTLGRSAEHRNTEEQEARARDQTSWQTGGTADRNPALMTYRYVEAYMHWAPPPIEDGEGGMRLQQPAIYKIIAIGNRPKIVAYEEVEDVPFATLVPDPMPHTLTGLGTADLTIPIQRLTTAVTRGMLDSLSASLNPDVEIVEGQVEIKDILETELGKTIRVLQPGMIQRHEIQFAGAQCLPVLEYAKRMREETTGTTSASQGLDPDILQSTTKAAVSMTQVGSQQRIEMIARIFAETGVRRLFRGLLKLEVANQNKPRVVRLRNQFVPVDPRSWDATMDVRVNVGLGTGGKEEKMAGLAQIAAKQEQTLQLLGPDNDLVTVSQYRNTLARFVELLGFVNAEEFFKEIDEQAVAARLKAESEKPPEPTPEQQAAQMQMQMEQMKLQADMELAKAKLALEEKKMMLEDDRERDKNETQAYLEASKIEAEYGFKVDQANLTAIIEHNREKAKLTVAHMNAEAKRDVADKQVTAAKVREAGKYEGSE